jgi:hypothetical protein
MKTHPAKWTAVLAAVLVAGCAQDGTLNGLNTGAINPPGAQTASNQALCHTLASQIAALNKDGIADKVSKAASKKYKMKSADLAKADELNKAHSEFQAKCSSYPPPATIAATTPGAAGSDSTATEQSAVKSKVVKRNPPVPSQKPVTAAMAPQPSTTAQPQPSPTAQPQASAATAPPQQGATMAQPSPTVMTTTGQPFLPPQP